MKYILVGHMGMEIKDMPLRLLNVQIENNLIPRDKLDKARDLARAHKEYVHQLEREYLDPVIAQWKAGEITDDQLFAYAKQLNDLRYSWRCPTDVEPEAWASDPIFPGFDSGIRMLLRYRQKNGNDRNGC